MKTNSKSSIRTSTLNFAALLITCFFMITISCKNDDKAPAPTQNIVTLAQGNSDLTSLVTALTRFPDLVANLSGSGNFTVFAPSNQAFANLLTATVQTSLDNIPDADSRKFFSTILCQVLLFAPINSPQATSLPWRSRTLLSPSAAV